MQSIRYLRTSASAYASTSSPTAVVRQALAEKGPLTTHALHSTLHSSYAPLPDRLPPAKFLRGASRLERGAPTKPKSFPGQEFSENGLWSRTFLKNGLLKPMLERGEVVKVTRAKWAKLHSSSSSDLTSSDLSSSSSSASPSSSSTETSSNSKLSAEWVWVLRRDYDAVLETAKAAKLQERGSRDRAPHRDSIASRDDLASAAERAGYGI